MKNPSSDEHGYFVYLLLALRNPFRYVGITSDPIKRLARHNAGYVRSTASRGPFRILVIRRVANREDARKAEKYFKSGYGRKYLAGLLARTGVEKDADLPELVDLTELDARGLSQAP